MSDTPSPSENPRSGPIYDNALRTLAGDEILAVCGWLGIQADPGTVRLSEALPSATQYADLLVGTGPGRLAQVEFIRRPARNLPIRMLEYRARIMRLEPTARLYQHVVVLAGGDVENELTDGDRFFTRFDVTYVRRQDPDELLSQVALAPLASLGAVQRTRDRRVILRRALQVIHDGAAPEQARRLVDVAAVLAAIHLDAATIEEVGREAAMPISLEGTDAGRVIAQRGRTEGRDEGRVEGRVEGRLEGRAEGESAVLAELLTARFGADDRIPHLARRLAAAGEKAAVSAVLAAATLDALET
ncbi:MAG: Rpn family recombination-promoting nuclease/putative transposase [Kineosporiaceae bacterium]|nr:Rpn family recombination-promoting nuclease/putative transposase [Kineosporiaceae bacterium]MBK7624051.1 Rpn family recombination-promoting nuclease/putative transposase [Kineosporiaceae bacterium]MBK8075806.1 Rpn family recombination-promoting nuclease/putative transposase [Kineosporiaceae bacterium]